MDNFKAIYRILSAFEKGLDVENFDLSIVGPDKIGVSSERWRAYIGMLTDSGYIKGVKISRDILGNYNVDAGRARITLEGLEYLQENSVMRRVMATGSETASAVATAALQFTAN